MNRTRAAGYAGPLQVGQDMTLIEVGDTVTFLPCPSASNPAITAVTNSGYQNKISAGDTVIVWGTNLPGFLVTVN